MKVGQRGVSIAVRIVLIVTAALLTTRTGWTISNAHADTSREHDYPISSSLPLTVQTFLRAETSENVFNVDYHYGRVTPAANGSYLENVGSSASNWYIEDQRYGDVDVIGGVLHDNLALIKTGLMMFDFGLDREAANGSFPGSQGLFHGVPMFLGQAGPAMLVLKDWYREPELGHPFDSHVAWEISRMKAAARNVVQVWWNKPGHIDDGGKEERKFEAAIALLSVGVVSNSSWLQWKAATYAREAVRMTQPDGVWTEHGITNLCCYDASYQAIGLVYATRYLSLLGSGALYDAVRKSVQLGERWEFSRTHRNGTVDVAGDDRTFNGKTCPESNAAGKCKILDLDAVFGALMRWGVLAKDGTYIRRAYFVWLDNWERVPGQELPAPTAFTYPKDSMTVAEIGYGWVFFVGATRFQPLEPVAVYFAKTFVGRTTSDQIGSFGGHSPVSGIKFTPPPQTRPGTYTITAQGAFGTIRKTTVRITQ